MAALDEATSVPLHPSPSSPEEVVQMKQRWWGGTEEIK